MPWAGHARSTWAGLECLPRSVEPFAWFPGTLATGLTDLGDDLAVLDRGGFWAVAISFEGQVRVARFAHREPASAPPVGRWPGVPVDAWVSSMSEQQYVEAVADIRCRISAGEVYQVNLCRRLTAPWPGPGPNPASIAGLGGVLAAHHPAPQAAAVVVPGLALVSASPELCLARVGDTVTSRPIKGTARRADELLAKDTDENVMIVDLVRNDLAVVCQPGTVATPGLCELERHPGLVHLVSTVTGRLRPGVGWAELATAVLPAGSVSGAPRHTALAAISDLEPTPRGPYCGVLGWVDADRAQARLAVAIRTFWASPDGALCFGTGAGITWGSDPQAEWAETELKAERLLAVAAMSSGEVAA